MSTGTYRYVVRLTQGGRIDGTGDTDWTRFIGLRVKVDDAGGGIAGTGEVVRKWPKHSSPRHAYMSGDMEEAALWALEQNGE